MPTIKQIIILSALLVSLVLCIEGGCIARQYCFTSKGYEQVPVLGSQGFYWRQVDTLKVVLVTNTIAVQVPYFVYTNR